MDQRIMNILFQFIVSFLAIIVNLIALIHATATENMVGVIVSAIAMSIAGFIWGCLYSFKHWRFQIFKSKSDGSDGYVVIPTIVLLPVKKNIFLNGRNKYCEAAVGFCVGYGIWSITFSIGYASFDPDKSDFINRLNSEK